MTIAQTSRESLSAISNPEKKTQGDDVLLVVTLAARAGVPDMTGQEIMKAYEARFGRTMYPNVISRVVGDLVKASRLNRLLDSRPCSISKKSAYPVAVPTTQARMFY
jgi:hypothetical protein